jgi:hypothetical protein
MTSVGVSLAVRNSVACLERYCFVRDLNHGAPLITAVCFTYFSRRTMNNPRLLPVLV